MKKLLSLLIAIALCTGACACAETTVQSRETDAYSLELNTAANTLILKDKDTRKQRVTYTEFNPLSDEYEYISSEGAYFVAANDDLKRGLLDSQGKLIIPLEYGDFELLNDRWIAGVRLTESTDTEENPDYRSMFGGKSYMIDTVDLYYAGEKKGTVTRKEWKNAKAFGDYLAIQDRDGNETFYNKDFVPSGAESSYA